MARLLPPATLLKPALVLVFVSTLVLGCQPKPEEWNEETYIKYGETMTNMGRAFAVHDICMPLIESDEEAEKHVRTEISAKRWAQLQEFDTAAEYDKVIDLLYRKGGTDEQIAVLEDAYQTAYDEADATIETVAQCEETLINYHNTILNTGVRTY